MLIRTSSMLNEYFSILFFKGLNSFTSDCLPATAFKKCIRSVVLVLENLTNIFSEFLKKSHFITWHRILLGDLLRVKYVNYKIFSVASVHPVHLAFIQPSRGSSCSYWMLCFPVPHFSACLLFCVNLKNIRIPSCKSSHCFDLLYQ